MKLRLTLLAIFTSVVLWGQNGTVSPYSYFGLGETGGGLVREGSLGGTEANSQANSAPLYPAAALLASLLKSPLHPCGDAKFRPMPEAIHFSGEMRGELG